MKILFHCLIKTYDAERQYIIYAHSNNKHEAEKQHTKKGEKIFLSYGLPHYSLLWGTLYLQRPWMCFSMHSRQSCFMFSTDCLSGFFSQGQYMQMMSYKRNSQYPFRYTISCLQVMGIARYLSIHHASLLLTIMKVVASKSNRLQGTMNEMNTQKSQTQTQYFYKPGYFKVLKITRNLII